MWDTEDTDLSDDEDYCPKAPGVYKWPLKGETGYYEAFYAGPFPPIECEHKKPRDFEYVGCYADSSSGRVFREHKQAMKKGRDGMTNEVRIGKLVTIAKDARHVCCCETQETRCALGMGTAGSLRAPER